jgi:hypothetical protein
MAKTTVRNVVEVDIKYDNDVMSKRDAKIAVNSLLRETLSDNDALKEKLEENGLTWKGLGVNLKKTVKKIVDWG